MNPDVFITIAFVGIAFLALLISVLAVLPQVRREDTRVQQRESSSPSRAHASTTRRSAKKAKHGAAVH